MRLHHLHLKLPRKTPPLKLFSSADLIYWLALNRLHGVGLYTLVQLVNHFGGPKEVLKAKEVDLRQVEGIKAPAIRSIKLFKGYNSAEKELKLLEKKSIHILTYLDPLYPPRLKEISQFPPILFVRGKPECLKNGEWLGVVGARNLTEYGEMICRKVVADLVKNGVNIVSGFARGIDITAHLTTIENGGTTVGVLGGGFGYIYPPSHRCYVDKVIDNGALITEFSYNTEPEPGSFPRRNRIISGLSRGVLVVEANEKSGALITARYALEQNRDLFAIPGQIFSSRSRGCHQLIQQGAKLVGNAQDILDDWKYMVSAKSIPQFADAELGKIYSACLEEGLTPDEIVDKTGYPAEKVTRLLTRLELEGKIKGFPGRRYRSL